MNIMNNREGNLAIKIPMTIGLTDQCIVALPRTLEQSRPLILNSDKVYIIQLLSDISNSESVVNEEQAVFVDGDPPTIVDITENNLIGYESLVGHDGSALSSILSRPVLIIGREWTFGSKEQSIIDPWALIVSNPLIQKVISNYHLFRANLVVRVVMNGQPFHMGRLMIGYRPFYNAQEVWEGASGYSVRHAEGVVSQLPGTGCCPLAPNKSESFEMVLPFFYDRSYLQVADYIAGTEPLGNLHFQSSTTLNTSNGQPISAFYSVFAHFEDVQLLVPIPTALSSKEMGKNKNSRKAVNNTEKKKYAKTQAKKLLSSTIAKVTEDNDEFTPDGIVSSVTSAFASAAGALKGVPFIGDFMGPAEGALNTATQFAKFFGFSKPAIATDPLYFRPLPISNLANLYGSEPTQKLTYDFKQTLTIDPSVYGISSQDDMCFNRMIEHWSLVTTFDWPTTATVGSRLFEVLVTPTLIQLSADATLRDVVHFNALGQAAYPFQYWRGSLEFLFVLSSSQYHSGRLAFTYDPDGTNHQPLVSNVQYVEYLDIQSADETNFTISMAQDIAYKEVPEPTGEFYSTLGTIYNPRFANGSLRVSVLNKLIAPVAGATVEIMMFVRGCEDFELKAPKRQFNVDGADGFFALPNALASSDMGTIQLVGSTDGEAEALREKVWFGENVVSLRALLKRYYLFGLIRALVPGSNGHFTVGLHQAAFPSLPLDYLPSFWPRGWSNTTNTGVHSSPLIMYRSCYAAFKGALRRKVIIGGHTDLSIDSAIAYRDPTNFSAGSFFPTTVGNDFASISSTGMATAALTGTSSGCKALNGAFAVTPNQQPVLEYEIPFYSDRKFLSTNWEANLAPSPETEQSSTITVQGHSNSSTQRFLTEEMYVATGEDFQFIWFLGGGTYRFLNF